MEPGQAYYFIVHAYHHFIGVVREVQGPNRVIIDKVIRVQSCRRGWTEFFRDGINKGDTTLTYWPDGTRLSGDIVTVPWNHPTSQYER
jgi:hypothetical protein